MTYNDLINDIKKLVNLRLDSIKPGAEIIIEKVDEENNRILIITANGVHKSRPLSEIRKIWEELCKNTIAHVDEVLGGSGSSRNQPETIFANLPYIEWFKLSGKKHIALVSEHTHSFGTLKKMDEVKVEELINSINESNSSNKMSTVVIITGDIIEAVSSVENVTGIQARPVAPGVYKLDKGYLEILVVSRSNIKYPIVKGTYIVIKEKLIPKDCLKIKLFDKELYVIQNAGVLVMVEVIK